LGQVRHVLTAHGLEQFGQQDVAGVVVAELSARRHRRGRYVVEGDQHRLVVQPRPAAQVVGVAERDGQPGRLRQCGSVVEQVVHADRRGPCGQLREECGDAGVRIDAAVEHGPSDQSRDQLLGH